MGATAVSREYQAGLARLQADCQLQVGQPYHNARQSLHEVARQEACCIMQHCRLSHEPVSSGNAVHHQGSQSGCDVEDICSVYGHQDGAHQVQHNGPLHADKCACDASFGADGERRMNLCCRQLYGAHVSAVQGQC